MISVLIIDDHALLRHSYKQFFSIDESIDVVGEVSTPEQAINFLKSKQVDVAIVDLNLAGLSGIDLIKKIRSKSKQIKLLVVSMHDHPAIVNEALSAGASGFISKNSDPEELVKAIHQVFLGEVLSKGIKAQLRKHIKTTDHIINKLTKREYQVVCMYAEGASTLDIANKLFLSQKTIQNYFTSIKHKLDIETDYELFMIASDKNIFIKHQ